LHLAVYFQGKSYIDRNNKFSLTLQMRQNHVTAVFFGHTVCLVVQPPLGLSSIL